MRAVALITVLVALVAGLMVVKMRERTDGHLSLPLDDGYIYLQYAKRLAQGHFLSYTEGAAPSTGASSWLHMLLLAPAFLAGLDGERAIWASIALGAVYLALTLGLTLMVARALMPHPGGRWWALGATAVVGLDWTVLHHAFTGMETVIYSAAMLAVVLALARPGPPRWPAFLAAGLLAWVRPEGAILGAAALLSAGRWSRKTALGFAILAVPTLVGWALTGTPQTDTFAVKAIPAIPEWAGRAERIDQAPAHVARQAVWLATNFGGGEQPWRERALLLAVGCGAAVALATGLARRERAVLLLAAFVVMGVLVTAVSWFTFARYTAPYAPLAIVWAARGFADVAAWLRPRAARVAWATAAAAAACMYVGTPMTPLWLDAYSWNCENSHNQQRKVGDWLREHTAPGTIVAVNDAGAIAYFSERPIIDLVGLTSHGWAACAHERPGGVFEKLEALPREARPSVLAVYEEVYPGMLRTSLVSELLFAATLPVNTINMSATKYVVAARWDRPVDRHTPLPPRSGAVVDAVNVAHLDSEHAHAYRIRGRSVSTVNELPAGGAGGPNVIEGARIVTGIESFAVGVRPGADVVLVARVIAETPWNVPVLAGGVEAGRLAASAQPGVFSECATTIPGSLVGGERLELTIGSPGTPRHVAYYWVLQEPR